MKIKSELIIFLWTDGNKKKNGTFSCQMFSKFLNKDGRRSIVMKLRLNNIMQYLNAYFF